MSDTIQDRLRKLRATSPAGSPTDRICRDASAEIDRLRVIIGQQAIEVHRLRAEVEALRRYILQPLADGVADASPAFQAIIDAAAAGHDT